MKTLISEEQIRQRVKELGAEISEAYRGIPFTCVVILKGSIIFGADLVRSIDSDQLEFDFVRLSSYCGKKSTGNVQMLMGELAKYEGKHLLLVEDVVDTGTTLTFFMEKLREVHPASVKICSLLEKKMINQGKVKIDFLGFDIPNEFIVGYGLDYNEKMRNIPCIKILDK
ncbi:hypoxanthine phosphoribosyltransferase [bacterium]|nr:hypoxanthine phosphoribosyltransferase [bacterium]